MPRNGKGGPDIARRYWITRRGVAALVGARTIVMSCGHSDEFMTLRAGVSTGSLYCSECGAMRAALSPERTSDAPTTGK